MDRDEIVDRLFETFRERHQPAFSPGDVVSINRSQAITPPLPLDVAAGNVGIVCGFDAFQQLYMLYVMHVAGQPTSIHIEPRALSNV